MTSVRRFLAYGVPFEAFTRDIWLVCLSLLIGAFGEGLYFWVFPLYVRALQADYVQLGLVYSILFGVSGLVSLAGGFLADRFDRKKLLLTGWMLWFLSPLFYALADNWGQLLPGAILWGASNIGTPAIGAYVVTSMVERKRVTSVVSFVFSTYSFAYIFAPSLGGFAAQTIGYRSLLYISALLTVASTCVLFFIHSQHRSRTVVEEEASASQKIRDKRALWRRLLVWSVFFTVITLFITAARSFVQVFLSEQIHLGDFYIGLFGSINFAGITFVGILMGRLGDKWRRSGAIALCLFLFTVSVGSMLVVRDPASLLMLAFLYGGSGVTGSLVVSYAGTIAPESKRALWISIPQSLSLFAAFAAPYMGGYLYTISPYYTFIVSVAAAPFLALFALLALKE
jgi:MFS family permease